MTWFQGSLLPLLSAEAPSVEIPLRVLYNQLTASAASSSLLIHLPIHSWSKCWLKTFYVGHPVFCIPPPAPKHKWFSDFLEKGLLPSSSILTLWEVRILLQLLEGVPDGQSEHCICLAIGIRSGMSRFTQRQPIRDTRTQFWDFGRTVRKMARYLFFLLLELLTAMLPPQSKKKW